MTEQDERDDHDTLILLAGTVRQLTTVIEAHNIASVERDTRIEQKVDRINGQVGKHELAIHDIERRPELPEWLTARVVTEGVAQHQNIVRDWPEFTERVEKMWEVFRFGRFFLAALIFVQPLEIAVIVHFWG
jgi:uncharacterized membrane protein YqiK